VAVVDQILVSAAHFAIGLSVARSGSMVALGLFGVSFLVINGAADLHRALVWLPMSQEADPAQFRTARRLSALLGTCLAALAVLAAIALAVTERIDWAWVAGGVAIALPVYFFHEVQRRIQFALLAPERAVRSDVAYAITALAGVVWMPMLTSSAADPAVRALAILAAAGIVGAAAGSFLLRGLPHAPWSLRGLATRYGPASRAYALNAGMVFASQRFSLLVLASVLGVDALARVEAARLLTAPLMVAALGLAALTVPLVSHALRAGGSSAMRPLLNRITTLAIIAAGLYAVFLALSADTASQFAFNTVYDHSATLGFLFCGIAATSLIASTLVAPLGLAGQAGVVPRARVPGVLLVVVASFPAALLVGEHAVLGLVLIEGVISVVLLRRAVDLHYPAT
jgi:hypothetical protein